MSGNRQLVQHYADQAQSSLRLASQLSSLAQIQMESINYKLIDFLPQQLSLVDLFRKSLVDNHELIVSISHQVSNQLTGSITRFESDFDSTLKPALHDLNSIINSLRQINIPSFLLSTDNIRHNEANLAPDHTAKLGHQNLADFISLEAIDTFETNIDIYKQNSLKLVDYVHTKMKLLLSDPLHLLNKRYNRILKQMEELIPIQLELKKVNSNGIIGVILRENSSLEKEVLSLLEMLTKHYDQCIQGVKLIDVKNPPAFNFEVLRDDSLEMPEVLKELTMVCDMILQNEERAEKLLNSELLKINLIMTSIKSLLQSYRDFKLNNIPRVLILLDIVRKKLAESSLDNTEETPIEQYAAILNQLTHHYSQTLAVYQSEYLQELHREQYEYPRLLLARISQFITVELTKLQQEEFTKRQAWMKHFGDFIPKEFKSPAAMPLPAVLQIDTEGLEHLHQDIVDGELRVSRDEKQLLDYTKEMMHTNLSARAKNSV